MNRDLMMEVNGRLKGMPITYIPDNKHYHIEHITMNKRECGSWELRLTYSDGYGVFFTRHFGQLDRFTLNHLQSVGSLQISDKLVAHICPHGLEYVTPDVSSSPEFVASVGDYLIVPRGECAPQQTLSEFLKEITDGIR